MLNMFAYLWVDLEYHYHHSGRTKTFQNFSKLFPTSLLITFCEPWCFDGNHDTGAPIPTSIFQANRLRGEGETKYKRSRLGGGRYKPNRLGVISMSQEGWGREVRGCGLRVGTLLVERTITKIAISFSKNIESVSQIFQNWRDRSRLLFGTRSFQICRCSRFEI